MLAIKDHHKAILIAILEKYPYTFYAFGSRANGSSWEFSDLDICYLEAIPDTIRYQIEEDLDQSNLPFKVDLVAWNTAPEWFRQSIASSLINIKTNEKVTIPYNSNLS